jgi:hypothetical protein
MLVSETVPDAYASSARGTISVTSVKVKRAALQNLDLSLPPEAITYGYIDYDIFAGLSISFCTGPLRTLN